MRVYLASTDALLRGLVETGRIAAGAEGFAATAGLRASLGDLDGEDLEFALGVAAAEASAAMVGVGPGGRGRRFVVVADVAESAVRPADDNPGAVVVEAPVSMTDVDAVLADPSDVALHAGVSDELAWFATQEIAHLLA